MSMGYVRRYYGVPAFRGRRVTYNGRPGVITSADHRLRVRFEGDNFSSIIHPTEDGLVYLEGWLPTDPAPADQEGTQP